MSAEPPKPPLQRFTFAGRMLLLAHLLLGVGGSALYVCELIPQLPGGRYPLLMFIVPVGIGCFLLFFALAWILERLGVRIYNR